jgi:L-2-hydroxycarboxylate dehydrogenase (NAD+)
MDECFRLDMNNLKGFCRAVYVKMGLTEEDAGFTTDVLVEADLRGIPTHGVRLLPRHVDYIQKGIIVPNARMEVLCETPTTLAIDAHHAMGAAVGVKTMSTLIRKAETMGTAFASVRNSTHFGIAGYYSTMALEKDMIGIAMTNANPVGLPTFGARGLFGTNPLAIAAPAGHEADFALDMATTVITNGKIETHEIQDKPLPLGWVVDKNAQPATDAKTICPGLVSGNHFILPLGGQNEDFSGHKGYNLAVLVDILSAALSGGALGPETRYHTQTESYPGPLLSHFFGAIKIAAFRDPADFRSDMDRMLGRLRECPPAPGQKRVYYAGLKEFEHSKECDRLGIPLTATTYESLCNLGKETKVQPPATR